VLELTAVYSALLLAWILVPRLVRRVVEPAAEAGDAPESPRKPATAA
jgi:hypothetical protein